MQKTHATAWVFCISISRQLPPSRSATETARQGKLQDRATVLFYYACVWYYKWKIPTDGAIKLDLHGRSQLKMNIVIREYTKSDLADMIQIWNDVIDDGVAFPQEDLLTDHSGTAFLLRRPIVRWQQTMIRGKSTAYISCTPIMLEDAVTFAMPAMRWISWQEACI